LIDGIVKQNVCLCESVGYQDDKDFLYEDQVLKDPYQVKSWCHYLEHKKTASSQARFVLYERAVKALPGSYKLWYAYLQERVQLVRGLAINGTKLLPPLRL
jgi:pre-mRNA-splicing factor SYF1